MRNRKSLLLFFCVSVLFLSSACSQENHQVDAFSLSIPNHKIAFSEQGVMFVENDMLWFYDFKQRKKVFMSNDPECESQPFKDKARFEPACNGVLPRQSGTEAVALHNKMVYLFLSEGLNEVIIYKQDPASDGREKIAEVSGHIYQFSDILFEGNFAYFVVSHHVYEYDDIGNGTMKDQEFKIMQTDLRSGKVSQLGETKYNAHSNILNFQLINNKLMFEYVHFDEEMDFQDPIMLSQMWDYRHSSLYEIDLQTGIENIIVDTAKEKSRGLIGFNENNYYMIDNEESLIVEYDLHKGQEISILQDSVQLYTRVFYDFYLYLTIGENNSVDDVYQYYKYDMLTRQTTRLKPPEGFTLPLISYLDWFLFSEEINGDHRYVAINHEDYYNGIAEYLILN